MRNNFDPNKPYRIIAVYFCGVVEFKITQPIKLWVFGYTKKYFPVVKWKFIHTIKQTIYFKDKKEAKEFISQNTVPETKVKEYIVFDSLKD